MKRREFLPGSGFLSRRDMTLAVESDVKPISSFLSEFRTNHYHLTYCIAFFYSTIAKIQFLPYIIALNPLLAYLNNIGEHDPVSSGVERHE